MIKAQLKSNFMPTFILSFFLKKKKKKKKKLTWRKESLKLERDGKFWLRNWPKVRLKLFNLESTVM
jgi:hypothetical protein